jgi:hypothetical protein
MVSQDITVHMEPCALSYLLPVRPKSNGHHWRRPLNLSSVVEAPFHGPNHGLTWDKLLHINELYDRFGPIPRICIAVVVDEDWSGLYQTRFDEVMNNAFVVTQLRVIVSGASPVQHGYRISCSLSRKAHQRQ